MADLKYITVVTKASIWFLGKTYVEEPQNLVENSVLETSCFTELLSGKIALQIHETVSIYVLLLKFYLLSHCFWHSIVETRKVQVNVEE